MKKFSLLLALVMMLSVFAVGCGGNDSDNGDVVGEDIVAEDTSLDDILAKGELVMGMDISFPPMGFIGEDGKETGFDVDLANAVCEKLGITLVPKAIDWGTKEMELANGNIDVIWNGYTMNATRNEQVEYTKPYLNNQQMVVVKVDSDIQTLADLAGKVVGSQTESAGLDAINADPEFAASLKDIPEYEDFMLALTDLGTSRLDAVVIDKVVIDYQISKQPGKYRVLEDAMGTEYYGIGCKIGAAKLREAIDNALDEMMEDGTLDEVSGKWFGSNIVIRDVPKLTTEELKAMEPAA